MGCFGSCIDTQMRMAHHNLPLNCADGIVVQRSLEKLDLQPELGCGAAGEVWHALSELLLTFKELYQLVSRREKPYRYRPAQLEIPEEPSVRCRASSKQPEGLVGTALQQSAVRR